jgi:hypothetical protein
VGFFFARNKTGVFMAHEHPSTAAQLKIDLLAIAIAMVFAGLIRFNILPLIKW